MVETILSVDVGGSMYMVGYVTPTGEILCSSRHEWVGRTPDAIVEQLAAACERFRAEHPDLAACEAALCDTQPERTALRIEEGRKSSWDARVEKMCAVLAEQGIF